MCLMASSAPLWLDLLTAVGVEVRRHERRSPVRQLRIAFMNRVNRILAVLLAGLGTVWASAAAPSVAEQLANPLRKTAESSDRSTPTLAVASRAESEEPQSVAADAAVAIHDAQPQARPVRQAAHSTPVLQPTAAVGRGTTFELSDGGYIVGDQMGPMKGEVLFEDFGGGDCCGGTGCQRCLIPGPVLSLDNFEFSTGVHGFTGPKNRGQSGSFGFHTGFNWGAPIPCSAGSLGMQFGLSTVFSNFNGASFTNNDRRQLFLTGGLFRRVDWGLQGGLVIDYLSDDWYTDTDLVQVRGEASWMFPCTHEVGFWFAAATEEDRQLSMFSGLNASVNETWEPTNLYAFFYRHRFATIEGANARFYAGFSGDSDGLIGGDLRLPLNCDWALEAGFAYLVPEEASTGLPGGGHEHESWNIGLSLVWYPGYRSAPGNDYYRPLFNVADNGNFMVTQR